MYVFREMDWQGFSQSLARKMWKKWVRRKTRRWTQQIRVIDEGKIEGKWACMHGSKAVNTIKRIIGRIELMGTESQRQMDEWIHRPD